MCVRAFVCTPPQVNIDQKIQEYLPTRINRATPKINHAAMQFVKVNLQRLSVPLHAWLLLSEWRILSCHDVLDVIVYSYFSSFPPVTMKVSPKHYPLYNQSQVTRVESF